MGGDFFGNFSEGIISANIRYLGGIFVLAHAKKNEEQNSEFLQCKNLGGGLASFLQINIKSRSEGRMDICADQL